MADEREQPNSHWTDFAGRFRIRSTAPTNPVVGDMYYDTTYDALEYWTGNNWLSVAFT